MKGQDLARRAEVQETLFLLRQDSRDLIARSEEEEAVRAAFAGTASPTDLWPAGGALLLPAGEGKGSPAGEGAATVILEPLRRYLGGGPPPTDPEREALRHLLGWELDLESLAPRPAHPNEVRWGRDKAWLIWEPAPEGQASAGFTTPPLGGRSGSVPGIRSPSASRMEGPGPDVRSASDRPGSEGPGFPRDPQVERIQPVRLGLFRTVPLRPRMVRTLQGPSFPGNLKAAVVDLATRRWLGRGGWTRQGLLAALPSPPEKRELARDHGGSLSQVVFIGENLCLVLERPIQSTFPARFSRTVGLCLGMAAVLLTAFWSPLRERARTLPIRWKFLVLFAYAGILPLAGVGVLAFGVVADRRESGIQETWQRARQELISFDAGFRLEEDATTRRFDRLLALPALARGDFSTVAADLRTLLDQGWIDKAEIRDWNNATLLRLDRGPPDPGFNTFTEIISRNAIRNYLGFSETRFAGETLVQFMANEVIQTPELGFVEITRRPQKLQLFKFGPSLFYWYWTLKRDKTSPWAFLNLTRGHHRAAGNYLRRFLVRNRPFRIFARDRMTGQWFPGIRRSAVLEAIANATRRTGEGQSGRLLIGGRSRLAFGLPGTNLERFDLVAVTEEEAIRRDARRILGFVVPGVGLALVCGLLCAILLGDSLLLPLANLAAGIQALRQRDKKFQVPVRGRDEMGRLAQAFNRMLETSGELDLAKVVQDCLVPSAPPELPGYEAAFRLARVSTIGGSYYDHLLLDDGRLAVLTGEVKGHGVAAALVIALAKAVVLVHFAEKGSPEALFPRLHRTLRELVPTRKAISVCVTLVDSRAHTVSYLLAGHPSPLLAVPGKTELESRADPSTPLGLEEVRVFASPPILFPPGSLLLVHTEEVLRAFAEAPGGYLDEVRQPGAVGPLADGFPALPASPPLSGSSSPGPRQPGVAATIAHPWPSSASLLAARVEQGRGLRPELLLDHLAAAIVPALDARGGRNDWVVFALQRLSEPDRATGGRT